MWLSIQLTRGGSTYPANLDGSDALYTFSFLMLLYFAVFSVISARERRWFWATEPSRTFMLAIAVDAVTGTVLTYVGLPGLMPLPWRQTLFIFGGSMISRLVLNDALKVAMIECGVPKAVTSTAERIRQP